MAFPNEKGETLKGVLEMPAQKPWMFALFVPCFTCPKESHGAVKISRALAEQGIAVLRFDPTGTGESGGKMAETDFSTRVRDVVAAHHALAANYEAPQLIIGHSIGGTTAIAAAKYLPSVQVVATVGSPKDPASIIDKFSRNGLLREKDDGDVEMMVMGRPVVFHKGFVEDFLAQNVAQDTAQLNAKLFVFHAPHDKIVAVADAQEIYNRAPHHGGAQDKELIILDEEATHLFENRADDAVFIANTVGQWCGLHVRAERHPDRPAQGNAFRA